MHLLGIDLGTSAVKAVVVDAAGLRVLGSGEGSCAVDRPAAGWSEQDPAVWWSATQMAVAGALADAASSTGRHGAEIAERIAGIGLAGQMHGLVALGADGEPLRPCILWNDQRSAVQCAALERQLGLERILGWTGNRVHAGFTLPKLLWMREAEPAQHARIRHVLLPKDWLRWKLCGEMAQEVTDASGTSCLDPSRRAWSSEMIAAAGIDAGWLPRIVESTEVAGALRGAAAQMLGLARGTPIIAGAGDQAAAAAGMGIVAEGACSATIGTSGVVFVARDRHAPDAEGRLHAFCHAAPDLWHQMGVVLSAGGALRWFRDVLAKDSLAEAVAAAVDPYEIICQRAQEAAPGCEGLTFLPYLAGERTPHADPDARGGLVGLTLSHTQSHVARAVLEGITFALADCLDLIRSTGARPERIRLAGGGARSRFWRQLCADVFGCEVAVAESTESGALGAALLAGVGLRQWPTVEEASRHLPEPEMIAVPSSAPPLEEARARFRGRYDCVRGDRTNP
jgi:xylulokinase